MSWSDDMRCLYCDGKLPLYRKITHGQFCSTTHRKAYWQEQERLAVERLSQTHNSLKATRMSGSAGAVSSAEAILNSAAAEKAGLVGFVRACEVFPQAQGAPRMVVADPLAYDLECVPGKPLWEMPEHPVRSIPGAGLLQMLHWWSEKMEGSVSTEPADHRIAVSPLPARMARPTAPLRLVIAPVTPEIETVPETAEFVPAVGGLLPLQQFRKSEPAPPQTSVDPSALAPIESLLTPSSYPNFSYAMASGLTELASRAPFIGAKPVAPAVHPANLLSAVPNPSKIAVARPVLPVMARPFKLAMGRGSRYPVAFRSEPAPGPQSGAMDFPKLPSAVALPAPPPAGPSTAIALENVVPGVRGLVALNYRPGSPPESPIHPLLSPIATIPQPPRSEHILPQSGLEPLAAKPVSDHFQPETPTAAPAPGIPAISKVPVWASAAGFWKQAPRDLKLLAFAIPLLLALAFQRQLPKVHVAAPAVAGTTELRENIKNVVASQVTTVRQAMIERAAVALDEDFRSGLDDWASRGDATAAWSFDATGFVRPGPLALYRPTMNLADYQVQFLGMIDKKALSWVVRAADFDNYYVLKLVVLKPGPRTMLGLTRYAVIHGKAENRVDTAVPIEAQPDTLYRVRLDMEGDSFSLGIQGQMIDSWSEPRLARGGIGFFTARGEESRVRWVAVTHQYDMLGRLCAYLAPYETTNGSW